MNRGGSKHLNQDEMPIRVITPRIFKKRVHHVRTLGPGFSVCPTKTVSAMTSAATLSIEEKLVLAQLVYVHGDADWVTITSDWVTHHAVKNKGVNDPQVSSRLSRARKLRLGD